MITGRVERRQSKDNRQRVQIEGQLIAATDQLIGFQRGQETSLNPNKTGLLKLVERLGGG